MLSRKRRAEENSVRLVIEILDREIMPAYGKKIFLLKKGIHKNPKSSYFKIFLKICNYLIELRGNSKNPLRCMIRDYLRCIFDYYKGFRRIPHLNQLSPSAGNRLKFEEWIDDFARDNEEPYFVMELPKRSEPVFVGQITVDEEIDIKEV